MWRLFDDLPHRLPLTFVADIINLKLVSIIVYLEVCKMCSYTSISTNLGITKKHRIRLLYCNLHYMTDLIVDGSWSGRFGLKSKLTYWGRG